MSTLRTAFILALGCVALCACAGNGIEPDQAKKDLEAVRSYFEKNHPGKKWEKGPAAINSAEVRAAYGGQRRFYYVFSTPPTRPLRGVRPSEEQARKEAEEFQQALAKFERERLSLTVGIDGDGKITLYRKTEDFNQGLMKVQNDQDAKVAAAAILSLFVSDPYSQRTVTAKEVVFQERKAGWNCLVNRDKEAWLGIVLFDAAGKCKSVSRQYAGPFPP